jgi:DNA primase
VLERAAVADFELDAAVEAQSLIAAATRREMRHRTNIVDHVSLEEDRGAKLDLMALGEAEPELALAAAESLLGWLHRRSSERSEGNDA